MKNIIKTIVVLFGLMLPINAYSHECPLTNCNNEVIIKAVKDVYKELLVAHNKSAKAKLYTIRRYLSSCRHPLETSVYNMAYYMGTSPRLDEGTIGKTETILLLLGVDKFDSN